VLEEYRCGGPRVQAFVDSSVKPWIQEAVSTFYVRLIMTASVIEETTHSLPSNITSRPTKGQPNDVLPPLLPGRTDFYISKHPATH